MFAHFPRKSDSRWLSCVGLRKVVMLLLPAHEIQVSCLYSFSSKVLFHLSDTSYSTQQQSSIAKIRREKYITQKKVRTVPLSPHLCMMLSSSFLLGGAVLSSLSFWTVLLRHVPLSCRAVFPSWLLLSNSCYPLLKGKWIDKGKSEKGEKKGKESGHSSLLLLRGDAFHPSPCGSWYFRLSKTVTEGRPDQSLENNSLSVFPRFWSRVPDQNMHWELEKECWYPYQLWIMSPYSISH